MFINRAYNIKIIDSKIGILNVILQSRSSITNSTIGKIEKLGIQDKLTITNSYIEEISSLGVNVDGLLEMENVTIGKIGFEGLVHNTCLKFKNVRIKMAVNRSIVIGSRSGCNKFDGFVIEDGDDFPVLRIGQTVLPTDFQNSFIKNRPLLNFKVFLMKADRSSYIDHVSKHVPSVDDPHFIFKD